MEKPVTRGPNRDFERVALPDDVYGGRYRGAYLLLYSTGVVKLSGYDRDLTVTEVLNRDNTTNGGHVFTQLVLRDGIEVPRAIQPRRDDLVTVRRETWEALMRVGRGA